MSRKKQWRLWLLSFLAIVALGVGATSQISKLTAKETRADPPTIYPLTWKDDITARGGKLKYGLSQARNVTVDGKTIPAWVPNLTYMDTATTEIRHIFDGRPYNSEGYPSGNAHQKNLTSTGAFNLIENDAEYESKRGIVRPEAGVVVLTDVDKNPLGDKEEITGTGFKATEKGLEVSVKMVSNDINSAVSHIYEVTNTSGVEKTFYPIKHVDTQLNFDDYVVVRSRGPGKGLYIEGREQKGRPDEKIYRLDYIMDTEDLAQGIHQPLYYRGFDQGTEFSQTFGPDKDNQGTADVIRDMNVPEGEEVLPLLKDPAPLPPSDEDPYHDSGIYMSWGKVTIPDGGTYKMRYDVGIRPLAELEKTKTAENLTSKDGKNRVGDTIEYTITLESPELAYKNLQVTDVLSEFFEHPTEDVTVTDVIGVNGNKTSYPIADVYNPTNRTLTVPKTGDEGLKIIREGKIELKFKVKLGANAAGQSIMNTAKVVGKTEEETTVDEEVTTKDPLPVENTGRVVIKYQDEDGNDIHPDDEIIDIVDEDYDANPKQIGINGYKYKEAKGDPLTGKITLADKEVIFVYSDNRFTIKQEVAKVDGSDAHNAAVDMRELLKYRTTVTSQLKQDTTPGAPTVYYEDFTLVADVSEHLTNLQNVKLTSTNGVEITDFIHDPVANTITMKVTRAHNITSDENLVLTYEGTVKDVSDVDIKAKTTASGTYSDTMVAKAITSNEVVSKRGAGNLEFTAPSTWDFGEREISDKKQEYSLAKLDEDILITDNRPIGSQWKLEATLTSNFTLAGSGIELPNVLNYRNGASISPLELQKPKEITNGVTTAANRGKAVNVTEDWVTNKEGLVLVVPGSIAKKGTYEAAITWTVTDAP